MMTKQERERSPETERMLLDMPREGESFRDFFMRTRAEEFARDELDSDPAILSPELEEQAALMDRLWQRHHDYVRQHGYLDDSTELIRQARAERTRHIERLMNQGRDGASMVAPPNRGSRTSAVIKAPRDAIYRAFLDPADLAVWQAPGDMTARVHEFDDRVGGGYRMSLYYSEAEPDYRGKTIGREDRFRARFVDLTPPERIVEAIVFDSDDPDFAGEMIMTVTLAEQDEGTEVTIAFDGIPPGIRPEDNDEGTRSSLAKLARLVESRARIDAMHDAEH